MKAHQLLLLISVCFCSAILASTLVACGEQDDEQSSADTSDSSPKQPSQNFSDEQLAQQHSQLGLIYAQRAKQYAEKGQDFYAALMMAKAIDFQGYGKPDARPLYRDTKEAQRFIQELQPVHPLWEVDYDLHEFSHTESMHLSFQGNYAVTGHRDGDVLIWDLSTRQLIRRWKTAGKQITTVKISEDESTVLGMDTSTTYLWSLPQNKLIRKMDIPSVSSAHLALSKDGTGLLCVGPSGLVQLWETTGGQLLNTYEGSGRPVTSIALTRDARHLAWADESGVIQVVNLDTDNPPTELKQHQGAVLALSFDQKDERLASGGIDQSLILWDYLNAKPLFTHKDHQAGVQEIRFNHRFNILITSDSTGLYKQRSAQDGKASQTNLSPIKLQSLGFNQDGLYMLGGADLASGRPVIRYLNRRAMDTLRLATDEISAVNFSPDGQRLALARKDGKLLIYEAWTGKLIQQLHTEIYNVTSLAFNEENSHLAAGSSRWLEVWSLETAEAAPAIRMNAETDIEFFKNKEALVAAGSASMRILSLFNNKAGQIQASQGLSASDIKIVNDQEVYYTAREMLYRWTMRDNKFTRILSFNAITRKQKLADDATMIISTENGQHLITRSLPSTRGRLIGKLPEMIVDLELSGDASRALSLTRDHQVHVWDTGKTFQTLMLEDREDEITAMAITRDAQLAAIVGKDGRLRVWRLSSHYKRQQLNLNHKISHAMTFSPDGQKLAMVYNNKQIRIFDTETGAVIRTTKQQPFSLTSIKLHYASDNQTLLLSRGTGGIFRLNPEKDEAIHTIVTRAGHIYEIDYSQDDRWAAIALMGKQPYSVNLQTGEIMRYQGHGLNMRDVRFLPDNKGFITCSDDGKILIWKLGEASPVRSFQHGGVRQLAVSPDGKLLVSGDRFGSLVFWDLKTGQRLYEIKAHHSEIRQLRFTLDGQRLISHDKEQWLRVWSPEGAFIQSFHLGLQWRHLAIGPNGQQIALSPHQVLRADLLTLHYHPSMSLYQYFQSGAYRVEGMNILPAHDSSVNDLEVKQYLFESAADPKQ